MNFVEKFVVEIIKSGPIPKHICCLMDGHRRYSKKNKIHLGSAYDRGFEKAIEVLGWSMAIGIEQVSFYAFSLENFKRSEEELTLFTKVTIRNLKELLMNESLVNGGVKVSCFGILSLLPIDLQQVIQEVVEKTKNGKKINFNLMVAYTAQEEISRAMKTNVENFLNNKISFDEITEESLTKYLYLEEPVDIVIRSSGVTRLSNFMMWQTDGSPLCFLKNNWPDIGFWNILLTVFYYQFTQNKIMSVKKCLKQN